MGHPALELCAQWILRGYWYLYPSFRPEPARTSVGISGERARTLLRTRTWTSFSIRYRPTKTTKGIETKISGDLWDRQKQWELKREILFDAAKRLSELDNKLLSLRTFWRMKTKGELEGATSQITLENKYVTEWQQAATSFEETETLVHVTCSKEAMTAFTELGNLMRSTASKIVHGDLEIYSQSEQERNKKFVMARVAIRKELGIKFDVTP